MAKLFISYAREDIDAAERIASALKRFNIDLWFDRDTLLPGQNWKHEILAGIRSCDYFLILLSSHSVRKNGVIQKEIREAIERAEERPAGSVFIIPARLEPVTPTYEQLKTLHWVDLFENWHEAIAKIAKVIGVYEEPQYDSRFDVVSAAEAKGLIIRVAALLTARMPNIKVQFNMDEISEDTLFYCDRYAFERSVEHVISNLRHAVPRGDCVGNVVLAETGTEFHVTVTNDISSPFPVQRVQRTLTDVVAKRGGISINYECGSSLFVATLAMEKLTKDQVEDRGQEDRGHHLADPDQ